MGWTSEQDHEGQRSAGNVQRWRHSPGSGKSDKYTHLCPSTLSLNCQISLMALIERSTMQAIQKLTGSQLLREIS